MPLPILDLTTHSWYRAVESAVEKVRRTQSIGEGGIMLGYSYTGDYSFPLIKFSPTAGDGLQGFLTGGDLLVYHIFARLARDVRTRIILDEPTAIQPSAKCAQPARYQPIVIPDSQGESQDIEVSDEEQQTRDAANLPAPLDLPESICWLNHFPWSPSGSWREMLLSVGPSRGRMGLEARPCMTVIVATLTPWQKDCDATTTPCAATATTTPATAPATSYSQKRKRLLEDDSQRSQESLFSRPNPSGSQEVFTLRPGDEGYVDLTFDLDSFMHRRTCTGCCGCSQCTNSRRRNPQSSSFAVHPTI